MPQYGLTEKGFIAKPFQVILDEERELFKLAFGNDIDVSDDSPEGAYIANQAIKKTQLWEMAEGLYLAGDPDTASGVYLDRLVGFVNVQRRQAQATRVYAALWGDEGTSIIAGHLAKTSTGEQFALQNSITLDRTALLGFLFKIAAAETGDYSFSIDGKTITYAAAADDDEEAIQEGLFNELDALFPGIFAGVNQAGDGMVIHSKTGIVPFTLFCGDEKIEIASLGAYSIYKAVNTGPVFVPIGGLREIITNVNGLDTIINYATGITGRTVESDAELRIEKNKRQRQASGNEIAIENAIKDVPGVLYARVYSNRTKEEKDGLPPNSYGPVVVGGVDQEIAEAIFVKGPGGIQSFGTTIVNVWDSEHRQEWPIGFSRPEDRYIWIKIAYSKNTEESFPINGVELMKTYIEEWGADNLDVGIDFIYQKINMPIYKVPGVGLALITVAATSDIEPPEDDLYQAANITIDKRQIAVMDRTRITIQELTE